jgi:hypothetical protein
MRVEPPLPTEVVPPRGGSVPPPDRFGPPRDWPIPPWALEGHNDGDYIGGDDNDGEDGSDCYYYYWWDPADGTDEWGSAIDDEFAEIEWLNSCDWNGDEDFNEDDGWEWDSEPTDTDLPPEPLSNDPGNDEDWQWDDAVSSYPAMSELPTPASTSAVTTVIASYTVSSTTPVAGSHEISEDGSSADSDESAPSQWLPPFDRKPPPPGDNAPSQWLPPFDRKTPPPKDHPHRPYNWFRKVFDLWDPTSDPLVSDGEMPDVSGDAETNNDGEHVGIRNLENSARSWIDDIRNARVVRWARR